MEKGEVNSGTFGRNLLSFYGRHQSSINISLLVVVSVLVFYNSLSSYFLPLDDFNFMLLNFDNIYSPFLSNTSGHHQGGNYRPMEVLSHLFGIYVFGKNNPFGHHLINLILHILNVIFVYVIAFNLTRKEIIGLMAGLLFALHPVHSQSIPPVAWISGRVDPLVSFFYLLTVILFIRFLSKGSYLTYLVSFVTFSLALMSKEVAATLPFVVILYVLLFPSYQVGRGAFSLVRGTLLLAGIVSLTLGIILNPNFIASYLSSDKTIEQSLVKKVYFLQSGLIGGGLVIIVAAVLLKLLKKVYASNLLLSLPYFVFLFFYLIARFFVLGGVGGLYKSEDEKNLLLQVGLDTFMRDIFSLIALVWPVGSDYNIDILTLQVEHTFIFFALSIIVLIALVLILFKLFTQSKTLTFSYLWIFITLMPVHNILINIATFRPRYLYLPSVGFCILISILLYKLTQMRNPSRLVKIVIAAFILFIGLNSVFIVKHNEKLAKGSDIMQKLASDVKRHRAKISDTANLYFITFPLSPIDTMSNVFAAAPAYMNGMLNFPYNTDGHRKKYYLRHLLFVRGEESSEVNISWLDDRNFIIDNIDPANYFLIPNEMSHIEKKMVEIYKKPPHVMLQSLPPQGETKETGDAVITVLKLDKESNRAKLKVELKEPLSKLRSEHFFTYKKGHFHLVKEFYGEE